MKIFNAKAPGRRGKKREMREIPRMEFKFLILVETGEIRV